MDKLKEKPTVTFLLSVDTEEEWDWSGPFPNEDFSIENIREIPAFQAFCQELGIKPTYLVDYAVANNSLGANILKHLNKNHCEIGAHLHPWANPPFYNETSEFSSHVINLPIEHVENKLAALISSIETNIGEKPKCFRTGRWGINGEVLKLLEKYGIDTDTSVYPLYDNYYFSCENAPHQPYFASFDDPNTEVETSSIVEIPVTCGFNRSNYPLSQWLHKLMTKTPFTWLRANGLLWHSLLLRKLYLSPELCDANDMIRLVKNKLKNGNTVFHMYLHSSSLIEQVTGLTNEAHARETICRRIAKVIEFLQKDHHVEFCTLSQMRNKFSGQI